MSPENISHQISWLDKIHKRYKETGHLIPPLQERLYRRIGAEWAVGRAVADIGCSIGYGTNILSYDARFVWGIDVCPENIDYATKVFKRPNIDFAVMDLEHPTTREIAKFELVVMSEVIEHLNDLETGLASVKRLFNSETIGFITAPNTNNPAVHERDAANSLHLQHWTAGEFYALMTQHFRSVTLYSAEKLDHFGVEETIDGNSTDGLIVAKVEGVINV